MESINSLIIAVVASLGLGNLVLALYQRWAARKDQRAQIHETSRGAELAYSDRFQDRLLQRLEVLENDRDSQVELLKRENARQEEEIGALQGQIRTLERQVVELTEAVNLLNQGSLLKAEQLKTLMDNCKIIQDAIERLGFVPTGAPSDEDNAAVQRLKEIREASRQIAKIAGQP